MSTIIYSGRELAAHFSEGQSRFLLVTFIKAHHESAALSEFFLREFVAENSINCIGITTHIRGYYVSDEMKEIARIVRERAANFEKVIVTGVSMGGYAALKYSGALGADFVIAFSPGYSIDPDDLDLPSDTHRKILQRSVAAHQVSSSPNYKRMGVRAEDAGGLIITVHDPGEAVDDYNIMMLRRHVPDVCVINACNVGHETNYIFRNPVALLTFLKAVLTGERIIVQKTFREILRSDPHVVASIVRKAAWRKPRLCLRALRSPRLNRGWAQRTLHIDPVMGVLAYNLFAKGEQALSYAHLARVYEGVFPPAPAGIPLFSMDRLRSGDESYLLLTVHGTFVGYDIASQTVRLDRLVFGRNDVQPVFAKYIDGKAQLYFLSGQRQIKLDIKTPVGEVAGSAPDPLAAPTPLPPGLTFEPVGDNRMAIRRGDRYVRGTDLGEVDATAEHPQLWEEFVPIPVLPESQLLKISRVGWFDQILMDETAVSAVGDHPAAPDGGPKVKRGPRWLKLFT